MSSDESVDVGSAEGDPSAAEPSGSVVYLVKFDWDGHGEPTCPGTVYAGTDRRMAQRCYERLLVFPRLVCKYSLFDYAYIEKWQGEHRYPGWLRRAWRIPPMQCTDQGIIDGMGQFTDLLVSPRPYDPSWGHVGELPGAEFHVDYWRVRRLLGRRVGVHLDYYG